MELADMVEELRKLLIEWEKYSRTLAECDVVPLPEKLMRKTVGLLDATAV